MTCFHPGPWWLDGWMILSDEICCISPYPPLRFSLQILPSRIAGYLIFRHLISDHISNFFYQITPRAECTGFRGFLPLVSIPFLQSDAAFRRHFAAFRRALLEILQSAGFYLRICVCPNEKYLTQFCNRLLTVHAQRSRSKIWYHLISFDDRGVHNDRTGLCEILHYSIGATLHNSITL